MALTLTAPAIAAGYGLSPYVTGFTPNGTNIGPFSVIFPAGGGCMLCDVTTGSGHLRTSPSTADNQLFSSLTTAQTIAELASGLASLNGHYYWSRNVLDDLVEVDASGTILQTIVSFGTGVRGIWPDAVHGYLYVALDTPCIARVDPVAKTFTTLVAITSPDGLVVTTDGTTVYSREGQYVRGYRTSDGVKVFDMSTNGQGTLPSPDGIGFYGSVLVVNDNNGSVYAVPVDGSAVTTIASGGSRGDFVSLHPDGSLILSQSDSFARLVVPLNPPTLVTATPNCGALTVSWNPGFGATGYIVYRSSNPRGGYQPIGSTMGLTFVDANVQSGVPYYYVVASTNTGRESGYSAEPAIIPVALPLTPTTINITGGCGQITGAWDAMACATSYNVYRSTKSGSEYTLIGSPSATTLVDATVVPGQPYFYRITSVGLSGETPLTQSPEYAAASSLPGTPMGVTATAGDQAVTLSWSPVASATTYNIYRGLASAAELAAPLATGVTTTSYADASAVNGTQYFYYVRGVSSCGIGMASAEVAAIPQCCIDEYMTESPNNTVWKGKACV